MALALGQGMRDSGHVHVSREKGASLRGAAGTYRELIRQYPTREKDVPYGLGRQDVQAVHTLRLYIFFVHNVCM